MIVVAAVSASYIEYLFHETTVGSFAMVSGGCYGAFRFSVGGAAVQMAKVNKYVPCGIFLLISLGFTIWSTFHVEEAASQLMIGGSIESAKIILITILWTAFSSELVLGIFSFVMDSELEKPLSIVTGNEKEGDQKEASFAPPTLSDSNPIELPSIWGKP